MSAEQAAARVYVEEPGGGSPRSVTLAQGVNSFGRGDHCDVRLDDESVSWDHLQIDVRGPSLLASDLDSSNGSFLNGEPLDRTRRLRDGDVLKLGAYRLQVALPPQARHERTAAAGGLPELSAEERETARALVAPYRSPGARAGRPATRAEMADALSVSERTAQRRLDALAAKLGVPGDSGRERPRLVADRVLELGADRDA